MGLPLRQNLGQTVGNRRLIHGNGTPVGGRLLSISVLNSILLNSLGRCHMAKKESIWPLKAALL